MDKGTRVTITKGKDGVGKTGVVFWSGPSKFGEGIRLGIKTDAAETFWCAASDVVRQGAAGAPADPPADPSGPSSPKPTHEDFEFFCRHPDEWFEGANMGHLISVAFRDVIDEEAERTIADGMYGGGVSFEKVLFSGRLMQFMTGGYGLSFLPKVEALVRKLHRALPVEDVVFHGIREGETGYAHPPVPSADMALQFGCARPVDLDAPPWAKGEEFSALLEAKHRVSTADAGGRRAREGIDKALAKQKKGPIVVCEQARPDVPPPDLSGFELAPPSARGDPPSPGDHPIAHAAHAIAYVFDGTSWLSSTLALPGDERRVFEVGMPVHRVSLSPGGDQALIVSSGLLASMNLESGELSPLPSPNVHETLLTAVALADGAWAALTGKALYLFDESNALIVVKKINAAALTTFAEGHGIALWKGPVLTVFRFAHGKLKQLHKFGYAPAPLAEFDGALYFSTKVGDLALVGAHADIEAELARSPRKAKAKKLECAFMSWIGAPGVEPPARVEAELPASRELQELPGVRADRIASSPSGEWVAFQNESGISVLHRPTAKVTPALPACSDFFMNDDGRLIALGFGQVMWRHAPESEAREWPGKSYSLELRKGRAGYLHDHDILVFFPDDPLDPPIPFACDECVYPLMPLRGLRDAFERDSQAYFRFEGRTVRVEGLRQVAARFQT